MKRLLALLLALMMCAGVLTACDGAESSTDETEATTEKPKLTDEVIRIKTPYAELCVPKSFENNVTNKVTNQNPYTVTFTTVKDKTPLFDIIFNGKGSVLMGTIVTEDGNTVLRMNVSTLKKDSPNYSENLKYQQGVNTITNHLQEDYDFRVNEEITTEDSATFDIETSLTTLKYPAKWKDKVTVKAEKDKVTFSQGDTPLFELDFKESDGFMLGTYKNTPIYIVEKPVKTDEQKAMQQDVNVIIDNLRKDENFKDGSEPTS